jgi:SagB-type dehydrogenase family enzyme
MNGNDYHRQTSYDRNRMTGHALDWAHRPDLYKRYPQAPSIPLPPKGVTAATRSLWEVGRGGPPEPVGVMLEDIAALLGLSYGITAAVRYPQETFNYRSAPSAGALYPCELYVVAYTVDGLKPGLYYFSVIDFALKQIRGDDIAAFLDGNGTAGLALSLYITGIPYRSAWKYRARAFRYVLLDTGHLMGNLDLVLRARDLAYETVYDLDTAATGLLLGLDNRRESGVLRIDAGRPDTWQKGAFAGPMEIPALPGHILDASQVSDREIAYPEIEQMQAAKITGRPAAAGDMPVPPPVVATLERWQGIGSVTLPTDPEPLDKTLVRRRSSRNYVPREIPADSFRLLLTLLGDVIADSPALRPPVGCRISLGFVASAVEGVTPGFYLLDPDARQYARVAPGQLASPMAAACLNQDWLKNAGVHFLFMFDPGALDTACGPLGYRCAMIQAGVLGQMVYLGATALGLGSCGIGAIYDDEAHTLLGLKSGAVLGYLVAAGVLKRTK